MSWKSLIRDIKNAPNDEKFKYIYKKHSLSKRCDCPYDRSVQTYIIFYPFQPEFISYIICFALLHAMLYMYIHVYVFAIYLLCTLYSAHVILLWMLYCLDMLKCMNQNDLHTASIDIDVLFSFNLLVTSYNFISNNGSFLNPVSSYFFKSAYVTYHVKNVTKRNMNIYSLCSSGFCVTHYFIWKGVIHQLPAPHTYNMYMHYINRKESLLSTTNFRRQKTLPLWINPYWGYMSDYRHYKNFEVSWLYMYAIHHIRDDFSTGLMGTKPNV